ncbi:diacylglycerol kinase family protein [Alkalibacter rhizosphaerae]|uniref:Diacylglycerol kinase family protein n=1 Tax=Alkalibacter rhizosphaerae TaxID=2815577 RepID=A0A974XEQ8_9FIRM|nr:diacylglycerol kinase family protein [Alkalibacter rhizosphaerae]QSX08396.1 diacylglycerol kinase family protein [Alkalibacter rhizosphaerae]
MKPMRSLLKSFQYAYEGMRYCLITQRNMRIHFFFVSLVTLGGIVFKIQLVEWIALFVTFSLVITSEMFNTAIEKTVDLVTEEWSEKAKIAKDVAAGAVLINAVVAVLVGFLVFFHRIVEVLEGWIF